MSQGPNVSNKNFKSQYSRQILLRLVLVTLVVTGLLAWQVEYIVDIYFRNQITQVGYVINGSILFLFFLGLGKIIMVLGFYAREERTLHRYHQAAEQGIVSSGLEGLDQNAIISQRINTVLTLAKRGGTIDHGALASTLMAAESTRISTPKFINSVLILTGVFGTIIALSIALLGASELIESSIASGDGIGVVIHGMSTALSTTITAIICYFFFGYFYLKMTDVQTNFLSGVEFVTAAYLIPEHHVDEKGSLREFVGLIRALQSVVERIEESQQNFDRVSNVLEENVNQHNDSLRGLGTEVGQINTILREGFRLGDSERTEPEVQADVEPQQAEVSQS